MQPFNMLGYNRPGKPKRIPFRWCGYWLKKIRAVITHQYSKQPFQYAYVIQTMEIFFKKRKRIPKLNIVHTDRGSIFRNLPVENFMEKLSIQIR